MGTRQTAAFPGHAAPHRVPPSDSRWQLRGGLENLFDKNDHDHLAGINRVAVGNVAVGDPIPTAGRFAYIEARYYW